MGCGGAHRLETKGTTGFRTQQVNAMSNSDNARTPSRVQARLIPGPMSAAERKRRQRARERAASPAEPILYRQADWQAFIDPEELPRKAGCDTDDIGCVVLKELLDDALDTNSRVEVRQIAIEENL